MLSGDEITGPIHEYAEYQKNIGKIEGFFAGVFAGACIMTLYIKHLLGVL